MTRLPVRPAPTVSTTANEVDKGVHADLAAVEAAYPSATQPSNEVWEATTGSIGAGYQSARIVNGSWALLGSSTHPVPEPTIPADSGKILKPDPANPGQYALFDETAALWQPNTAYPLGTTITAEDPDNPGLTPTAYRRYIATVNPTHTSGPGPAFTTAERDASWSDAGPVDPTFMTGATATTPGTTGAIGTAPAARQHKSVWSGSGSWIPNYDLWISVPSGQTDLEVGGSHHLAQGETVAAPTVQPGGFFVARSAGPGAAQISGVADGVLDGDGSVAYFVEQGGVWVRLPAAATATYRGEVAAQADLFTWDADHPTERPLAVGDWVWVQDGWTNRTGAFKQVLTLPAVNGRAWSGWYGWVDVVARWDTTQTTFDSTQATWDMTA